MIEYQERENTEMELDMYLWHKYKMTSLSFALQFYGEKPHVLRNI